MHHALRKYAIGKKLLANVTLRGFGFSFSIGNFQCYTWTCDFGRLKDKFNWTLVSETIYFKTTAKLGLSHFHSPFSFQELLLSPNKNSQKASLHCRTSAGRSSLKQPCSTQPCMVTESKGPLISSKLWPHRSTNNAQVWPSKPFFGGRCSGWVGSVGNMTELHHSMPHHHSARLIFNKTGKARLFGRHFLLLEAYILQEFINQDYPTGYFFWECQVCLGKQHDRYKMGPYPVMCGVITL